jgi:hypothetical protein
MRFAKKFLEIWKKLRKNWKIKYHLILWNDNTQHQSFSLKLSPRNVFVVVTTSTIILIVLVAMLIAFTPLRVYVPGYTNPDEYKKYREMAHQIDSVELLLAQNQQYIDNFRRILNNEVMPDEMQESQEAPTTLQNDEMDASYHSETELALRKEAATLLQTLSTRDENTDVTIKKKANLQHLSFRIPVDGTLISSYDFSQKKYGIDIANKKNTLIVSAADGIVIYSGLDVYWGNVILIQHHDNVVSVYAHNQELLKQKGNHVLAGEPIATMGASNEKKAFLHFELWHNGFSLNPIDYLSVQ